VSDSYAAVVIGDGLAGEVAASRLNGQGCAQGAIADLYRMIDEPT
jgi:hypothetical protein